MKLEVVVASDDRGAEDRRGCGMSVRLERVYYGHLPMNMHRAGVRGNPVRRNPFKLDMGYECPGKLIIQEVDNVKGLGIMLLIVALMIVGVSVFGSVNQYEIETGLTVDALMLSLVEKTVEAKGVDFVNSMAYAESAIATINNYDETPVLIIPYKYNGALMEVTPATDYKVGGVTVCLKFPFL